MRCPYCGSTDSKVTDSRMTESGDAIRRRRECLSCSQRFTTFERLEETPITIIKKGGEREPFDRQKLLGGLLRATVKRHTSREQLEELVSDIEADLRNQFRYEVTAKKLGDMILDRLRVLDKVAYVRFA
ncbi:MAG: transcriptional regulator NrdR, partial [Actinomycetota bacterium]|nr:transcriptional regulator NrdR [Actinomycetota bacterium]